MPNPGRLDGGRSWRDRNPAFGGLFLEILTDPTENARNNGAARIVRSDVTVFCRVGALRMHDWQQIRRLHGAIVFRAVFRILKHHDQALDCYQEVFLEAFEQCGAHRVDNWPAFLRWLAVRRALDRLRSERRRTSRVDADEDPSLLPGSVAEPSAEIEFRELMERVRRATARLPDRQGEAFWLHCVEQLTYAEVAEQFGTDTNAVGILVHRARARLRKLLTDLNPSRVEE